MKGLLKQLKDFKSITGIDENNKTISSKRRIKITVSKADIVDGEMGKIYELLNKQTDYDWDLEMVD